MASELNFSKIDLYDLFEISPEADESAIKKAYRKKALAHHPDKNPDNPKAKEIFQKIKQAFEVLSDKDAKASYDKILKARKEQEIKYKKLNEKRRKLKDELEEREKFTQQVSFKDAEERLRREIERIRKEGSKQLEKENIILKQKLEEQHKQQQQSQQHNRSAEPIRVRLKRKGKVQLTQDLLLRDLAPFGPTLLVIVAPTGKSALVEFEHFYSVERLLAQRPDYLKEVEVLNADNVNAQQSTFATNASTKQTETVDSSSGEKVTTSAGTTTATNHEDYEDYVLRQLQQAAAATSKAN